MNDSDTVDITVTVDAPSDWSHERIADYIIDTLMAHGRDVSVYGASWDNDEAPNRTRGGTIITDELTDQLAREAERGYDLSKGKPQANSDFP